LAVERERSPEEIIEAVTNTVPHKKGAIMTAAQQLQQRGMQQGRQEGMQTEKLHIAKNMLAKGLAIHLIRELAGVSEEDLMRLQEESSK
jgi:recombination-promoting nuclease RpnB